MWIALITIGIIAFIAFSFFNDRKLERQQIESKGGMKVRYRILLEYLLSYPNAEIRALTSDRIDVVSKSGWITQYFMILHTFSKVVLTCRSVNNIKDIKENWEFKTSLDQSEMVKIIDKNIAYRYGAEPPLPSFVQQPSSIPLNQGSTTVYKFPGSTMVAQIFNDYLNMSDIMFEKNYSQMSMDVQVITDGIHAGRMVNSKNYIFQGDYLGATEYMGYTIVDNSVMVSYTKVNDFSAIESLHSYLIKSDEFDESVGRAGDDFDFVYVYQGDKSLPESIKSLVVQVTQVQFNVKQASLVIDKHSLANKYGIIAEA
jgi:hypothetical protein